MKRIIALSLILLTIPLHTFAFSMFGGFSFFGGLFVTGDGISAAGGGGGVPTVIDTQTGGVVSDTPTSVTLTIPSGASTGDIIVVFSSSRNSADTHSMSVGTKLGEVNSSVGSQYSIAAFYYTITGSDVPGSTTFTVSSNQTFTAFSVVAITVDGASAVDVSNIAFDGSFNTTVTAPSVTTTADNALILLGVGQPTASTYSSGTYTELAEATTGTAGLAAYSTEQALAGSTGSFNVTASGSNYGYGATVALIP